MSGAESRWTEKYRPQSLREILGNGKAMDELRQWAESWKAGSPVTGAAILYGPAGTGKTSAALVLAKEFEWDYIEMNASDARTAGMIQRIAGPASRSGTFSGQKRLVILDEADNLHGTADRGGAAAMLRLVRETNQPVLLIANEYYEIEKPLRDAAKGIQFRSIRSSTIAQAMRSICRAEEIACDPDALDLIAERAGGDLRSAVNDLQAAAEGQSSLMPEDVATAERDVKASIFKVLEVIFKGQKATEAQAASYDLDESPEDLIQWVDENLPLAYQGEDLFRGYESLARADVFLGRVGRRQNYGLWRYASFLMTGGVQAARAKARHGYVAFRPPGLWRRLGQSRKARGVRDSAARKIALRCHVSAAFARAELMGFVGLLLKDRKIAPKVAAELDFEAEEIAMLMESTPATKKVQTIFEEAQRLRESEAFEEIELAWHGTSQRSLERASEASEPTKRLNTKRPGKERLETEGQKTRQPEEQPNERTEEQPESKAAGKGEKREKQGRTPSAAAKEGSRRQKSLFDF